MTLTRAFSAVVASALGMGTAGATIGYLIGRLAPDYYRIVLRVPPDATDRLAETGLALGLVQGLMTGVGVGLVIVLAVTWHSVRTVTAQNREARTAVP